MARDKARHKRYEFLFDLEGDSDLIDKIAGLLRPGYSLADHMRVLMNGRATGVVPHEHAALPPAPARDDIRELWRVIGELKEDIAALQCGVSTTPKTAIDDSDQQRHDKLSGKLKRINFKVLTQ